MKFKWRSPLDWFVVLCLVVALLLAASRLQAQVFNCSSGFASSGACQVGVLSGSGTFQVVGSQNGSTPALSGTSVLLAPTGATHTALSLMYHAAAVNVQAFTTTFTFVPNGQNIAFTINNATGGSFNGPSFSSGAGCEAGFFQAFVPPNPLVNKILGIELDSYSNLTSTPSFTYSSAQLYQINQSPCNPNDSGPNYWLTNKISTSPVPLNSPAGTANTTTGDTYSATITYDGSNLTLKMFDVTAGGSCPGASCFTQTWSAVDIPAIVNGNTAYVGFTEGTGTASSFPLYIKGWQYTVNSAPSLPSLSTYTAQANAGASSAASVTFSPGAGTYSAAQNVTLSSSTSGANICYVLAAPSSTLILPWPDGQGGCQNGTSYSGPVTVSSSQTLYAVAGTTYTGLPSIHTSSAYAIVTPGGCVIAPGASVSQIQTAINSAAANSCPAPSTSTASFSPGSYTISSLVTVPCPVAPMTITGPVVPYVRPASVIPGSYSYASPYTAILNGTLGSSSGWQVNACSTATTIQYLEWNGNQQSGGGGGWLSVTRGTSNLTVQNNYIHGNWASTSTSHDYDDAIALEGVVGFSQFPIDTNVRIIWNVFGNGTSDCNPIMNLVTYQGDSYIRAGGYCGALGVHVSTTNLVFQHNDVEHLEQPLKFFQGSSSPGDITHTLMLNNALIDSNDFGQWHRIVIEGQQSVVQDNSTGGVFNFTNNSTHDPIDPEYGMFGASIPMCCSGYSGYSTNDNQVNCNSNTMVDNVASPSFTGYGSEWWSTGSCSNNLFQGHWNENHNGTPSSGAIGWGNSSQAVRTWVASNNTCQFTIAGGVCVGHEAEGGTAAPIQSGNVTTTTIATITSVAPTISPAAGSKSYPLTVTLTDPGYTTGSVPQGNTGIWYTIDGTTPVPGAGSAKYLSTGQTFILSGPATVQAVGMWGALNQPTNYPSGGYGWTPSAVVSAAYTTGGAVTLSSVTIAPTGGVATLNIGQTVQMIVICHYSDGSTSGCNTTDSHGNAVTAWSSSNGNVAVSSSGLATAAAVGTATVTATVTGGVVTSPGFGLTVNAPPLTLSSITVATTGGVTSITAPANNQLLTTCHYNDGTATSCNAMDSHGNAVTSAVSSAPAIATVTSPGSLATGVAAGSTNLTTTVIPTPSMLGTSLQNVSGYTNNGFINEIYGVTGTSAGSYTPGNCHITIPATTNWTAGKLWTCLLVLGTPTTQNSSAVCSASFTMTGTSWPGGDIVIPMTCPTLPPDTGYWVGSTTNQTTASPVQGFSNCGGNCSGGPPIFGSGTYSYSYVANPFGNYTALPTTLNQTGTTPGLQVSQYILLTTTPVTSNTLLLAVNAAPPTLLSAYITGTSSLVVPNTGQMAAKCHYTSGPDQDCTVADIYGNAVSAWLTSDATKATVQNVGGASPGLVTAVAAGTPSITAVINNAMNSTAYPITVTNPAISLTGITLSTAGGITGLFQGNTNQLKATCSYSDGSNDDCTNTDAHGNKANTWTSTTPGHASINATSGLVTAVAPGGTTFTAKAGTFTSPALPLTVLTIPSGVYTITIRGPIRFSGTVRF
jgi:Legume lectin domain/Bacterial Ig-like domain (group 2)